MSLAPDDHDVIIWIGDLNYRIGAELDIEIAYQMIESQMLAELLEYDQLIQEKEFGVIFDGFNEGLISFPPTYQYIAGTSQYDRRPDGKNRCPAWCDRILWRCGRSLEKIQAVMKRELRGELFDNLSMLNNIYDTFSAPYPSDIVTFLSGFFSSGFAQDETDREEGEDFSRMSDFGRAGGEGRARGRSDEVADRASQGEDSLAENAMATLDFDDFDRDRRMSEREIERSNMNRLLQAIYGRGSVEKVELIFYDCVPDLVISDHKPVRALMNLKYKK